MIMTKVNKQWSAIAENYFVERDTLSFPALLIDKLILELLQNESHISILDYGAGSGTLSRLLSGSLGHKIVAYEPMPEMMEMMLKLTPNSAFPNITFSSNKDAIITSNKKFDAIICINVFDHILDISEVLNFFNSILSENGRLILSIPHPLKNIGSWVKNRTNNNWEYLYYRLDGYLQEGEVKRNREDVNGNLIIENVVSQHRTISTYYNWIFDSGFEVIKMYEPSPDNQSQDDFPMLFTQAYRIPYFWILDCRKK
jgi:ubiquinone/menaquinone biosynthesis C-methylase UbiE